MNPLEWIRWRVLAAILVVGGLVYFLGVDSLVRWRINDLGARSTRARWHVGSVDLRIFSGHYGLADLLVAGRRETAAAAGNSPDLAEARVFSAERASFDLGMDSLLCRRFVIERLEIHGPEMRIERRRDGSTNLDDVGEPEEEAPPESPGEGPGVTAKDVEKALEAAQDWLETARKWYRRIEWLREKLRGDEGASASEQEARDHYARRALYPFAGRPRIVIREVVASGLEIDFSEEGGSAALPRLEEGRISLKELSDRPTSHDRPIELSLEGLLERVRVALNVRLDLTGDAVVCEIRFDTGPLPARVIDAFVGRSLPVKLSEGTIGVTATVRLGARESLSVAPTLRFSGVRLATRPGARRVAGLDAREFVQAFNEASRLLDDATLEIADLRITGTLSRPRFQWGDTVEKLVRQGARAFVQGEIEKAEAKGREVLEKEAGKVLERLDRALEQVPGAKDIKEGLERILPGLGRPRKKSDSGEGR
ncbi:MAG: hypothetical protein O7J95_15315 [Planctomycetota bacterium]|nr:hypothetical protein [Planctomycetota bacterium]